MPSARYGDASHAFRAVCDGAVHASNGSSRYITDLLSTSATPVLSVSMPNDFELYGPYANSSIPVALIVCYPTDASNPYAGYTLPTGSTVRSVRCSLSTKTSKICCRRAICWST